MFGDSGYGQIGFAGTPGLPTPPPASLNISLGYCGGSKPGKDGLAFPAQSLHYVATSACCSAGRVYALGNFQGAGEFLPAVFDHDLTIGWSVFRQSVAVFDMVGNLQPEYWHCYYLDDAPAPLQFHSFWSVLGSTVTGSANNDEATFYITRPRFLEPPTSLNLVNGRRRASGDHWPIFGLKPDGTVSAKFHFGLGDEPCDDGGSFTKIQYVPGVGLYGVGSFFSVPCGITRNVACWNSSGQVLGGAFVNPAEAILFAASKKGNIYLLNCDDYDGIPIFSRIVRVGSGPSNLFGLDSHWDSSPSLTDFLTSAAEDTAGRLVVGGQIFTYGGVDVNNLIRLVNGNLDGSFLSGPPPLGPTNYDSSRGQVSAVALQSDGKILVGGRFDLFHNFPRTNLVRLNTNGSVDPTFNARISVSPMSSGLISSPLVLPTGNIVVSADTNPWPSGGGPNNIGGADRWYIAFLDPSGNVLPTS